MSLFDGMSSIGSSLASIVRDPFVQARNIYDQNQQAQSQLPQQIMVNDPFGGPAAPAPASAPPPSAEPPQSKSLIGSLDGAPKMEFEDSDLPKMLQKLGIDDKGLKMNALGRVQLISRLQQKYPDFHQNADALQVLSVFDQNASKTPMDNSKDIAKIGALGERTLSSLLGGGVFGGGSFGTGKGMF